MIVILSKRFCAAKDLGEPRGVWRFLRHNNRAFGSLPYQAAPLLARAHMFSHFRVSMFKFGMFKFRMRNTMRSGFIIACAACLAVAALGQQPAQQPTMPTPFGEGAQSATGSPDSKLPESKQKDMFQSKIKAEWEAIKNKDKKAYADLLADDYQGVEVDGRGERNRIQAINELVETNVFNYTLWGFKFIPAGPDAALVIYEVTMQFPPKSQIGYSRVYISELWIRNAGQWKISHYQETHVK